MIAPFSRRAAVVALLVGCADPPVAPVAEARWACPPDWVAHAGGGCGPAVVLCADGTAAPGACRDVDVTRARTVTDADGETGQTLHRAADGAFAGAWPAPGAPGGPPADTWSPADLPAADWSPAAGVASCPPAWTRRDDGSCDPRLRDDCAPGAYPVPGGRCTPTAASDCPAGEFADVDAEAGAAPRVYVRAGADDSVADGSLAHPHATLAHAVATAPAGAWILVARGTYEGFAVARSLHVVGACAAGVTVTSLGASAVRAGTGAALDLRGVRVEGVVEVGGGRASVRASVVSGASPAAVLVRAGGVVALEDVALVDGRAQAGGYGGHGVDAQGRGEVMLTRVHVGACRGYGVVAAEAGTSVTARDVLVRDTRVAMDGGVYAGGVAALRGGRVTLEASVAERNAFYGVVATGAGATVQARDVVVSASVAGATTTGGNAAGYGLFAREGGAVTAANTDLRGNRTAGAIAASRGAVALTDALVRDTRATLAEPGGTWTGAGLAAIDGGSLRATRTRVTGNEGIGATGLGAGSEVALADAVIEGGGALPEGAQGDGAAAADGAHLTLERVAVSAAHDHGVVAAGDGAVATVRASVVRGTRPREGAPGGLAVSASQRGRVEVTGSRVVDTVGLGVVAGLPGDAAGAGSVAIDGVAIERTVGPAGGALVGVGVAAFAGAEVTARGSVIDGSSRGGVAVDGATVALSDGVIRATGPNPGVTFALSVVNGGAAVVARVAVARNRVAVAVSAEGEGSRVRFIDGAVTDTAAPEGRDHGGQGMTATRGGALTVRRVRIEGSETVGLSGYHAGTRIDAADVLVARTAAGPEGDGRAGGVGVLLGDGAAGAARRVVVAGSHAVGVWSAGEGSSLTLDDAIVDAVDPLPGGLFGEGVVAMAGGRVNASRVAVLGAHGFALGAAATDASGATAPAGAALTAGDVFARGVATSVLRAGSVAPPAAYGVHAGAGCSVALTRAVIEGAEWGFFQSGGGLSLRDALVARQTRGGGASNGASAQAPLRLEGVVFREAGGVARDVELPEALLPSPPAP